MRIAPGRLAALLALLAALALLPYLPSLGLPFITDDYEQIYRGRLYGPVTGWSDLASHPLYRCRATSLVLTYWTDRLFGLDPLPYRVSSLVFHILNTWLVFALGFWPPIGWRLAATAAGVFAVVEGHQEAVIWYAALPELLVFFFSLGTVMLFAAWLQRGRSPAWLYAVSLAAFLLALFSKESAVAVVPLLAVPLCAQKLPPRRWVLPVLPFAALAAAYTWMAFQAAGQHQHFNDGTFSLHAPVLLTWSTSLFRMLRFWGLLALLALVVWRTRHAAALAAGAAWMGIALLPYCFLLYMPQVPSRHTYLASAGLALIVAAGLETLWRRFQASRRWIPAAAAMLFLLHNCGYTWTKKQRQYRERAAPLEALLEVAAEGDGPIYVECFPYPLQIAIVAVELKTGKPPGTVRIPPLPDPLEPGARRFCWGSAGGG